MIKNGTTVIGGMTLSARLIIKTIRESARMTGDLHSALTKLGPILRTKQRDPRYGHPANCRRVDGKLYWHPHIPGYPSTAFDRVFNHWLNHNLNAHPYPGLYFAHVAITKTCGLNCKHCFEWDSINQPETRTDEEIIDTIERLIELGAAQIILSGGEPLARFPFLLRILNEFRARAVQFWINTSATDLTAERIDSLKKRGLTGIIFSLDHHDMRAHDDFRGKAGCYQQAIASARTAASSGLVTALSLCATNEYVTAENLEAYMQLARDLNITFVEILEPKPIGKYAGQEVSLRPEKQRVLESFYNRTSSKDAAARQHPLISYSDYHNRRYGCEGGRFHLYVDTDGRAYPCPFCKSRPTGLGELTPSNLQEKLVCPNAAAFGI